MILIENNKYKLFYSITKTQSIVELDNWDKLTEMLDQWVIWQKTLYILDKIDVILYYYI